MQPFHVQLSRGRISLSRITLYEKRTNPPVTQAKIILPRLPTEQFLVQRSHLFAYFCGALDERSCYNSSSMWKSEVVPRMDLPLALQGK